MALSLKYLICKSEGKQNLLLMHFSLLFFFSFFFPVSVKSLNGEMQKHIVLYYVGVYTVNTYLFPSIPMP